MSYSCITQTPSYSRNTSNAPQAAAEWCSPHLLFHPAQGSVSNAHFSRWEDNRLTVGAKRRTPLSVQMAQLLGNRTFDGAKLVLLKTCILMHSPVYTWIQVCVSFSKAVGRHLLTIIEGAPQWWAMYFKLMRDQKKASTGWEKWSLCSRGKQRPVGAATSDPSELPTVIATLKVPWVTSLVLRHTCEKTLAYLDPYANLWETCWGRWRTKTLEAITR